MNSVSRVFRPDDAAFSRTSFVQSVLDGKKTNLGLKLLARNENNFLRQSAKVLEILETD